MYFLLLDISVLLNLLYGFNPGKLLYIQYVQIIELSNHIRLEMILALKRTSPCLFSKFLLSCKTGFNVD